MTRNYYFISFDGRIAHREETVSEAFRYFLSQLKGSTFEKQNTIRLGSRIKNKGIRIQMFEYDESEADTDAILPHVQNIKFIGEGNTIASMCHKDKICIVEPPPDVIRRTGALFVVRNIVSASKINLSARMRFDDKAFDHFRNGFGDTVVILNAIVDSSDDSAIKIRSTELLKDSINKELSRNPDLLDKNRNPAFALSLDAYGDFIWLVLSVISDEI